MNIFCANSNPKTKICGSNGTKQNDLNFFPWLYADIIQMIIRAINNKWWDGDNSHKIHLMNKYYPEMAMCSVAYNCLSFCTLCFFFCIFPPSGFTFSYILLKFSEARILVAEMNFLKGRFYEQNSVSFMLNLQPTSKEIYLYNWNHQIKYQWL